MPRGRADSESLDLRKDVPHPMAVFAAAPDLE
jgi:hypothetical protein